MVVKPFGYDAFSSAPSLLRATTMLPTSSSVTGAVPMFASALQTLASVLTAKLAGAVTIGGRLPCTSIDWLAELVLPDSSVAVHMIEVSPIGYGAESSAPSLRALATVTFGQLSTGVALPIWTVALFLPRSVRTEMSAGAPTSGFSLSSTVIVWVALEVRLPASVAVHVIVVTPFGYAASSGIRLPSLLTPVVVTPAASSVTVGTPGLTTAEQTPTPEAAANDSLRLPEIAGGAVVTSMLGGAKTTGGWVTCDGEKRTAEW